MKNLKEDFFFVTNCDVVINEDYKKILKNHIKNKNDMTIVVSRKSIKLSYGVCLLNKKINFQVFKKNQVTNFVQCRTVLNKQKGIQIYQKKSKT